MFEEDMVSWVDPRSVAPGLPEWPRSPASGDRSAGTPVSSHGVVAWALAGQAKIGVWDPSVGLISVPDLVPRQSDPRMTGVVTRIRPRSLSPDGTTLRLSYNAAEVVYDLLTRARFISAPVRHGVYDELVHRGPNGAAIDVSYPPHGTGKSLGAEFFEHRGGDRIRYPFTGRPAFTHSGPGTSIQFSRDGARVAISLEETTGRGFRTMFVDLTTFQVTQLPGWAITSQGAWSPYGERLIMTPGLDEPFPFVHEIGTTTARNLAPLLQPEHLGDVWTIAGWLDDTRLTVHRNRRRRLEVATLDLDTGEHEIVAETIARPHAYFEYAPWAAQNDPTLIGRE